MILIIGGAYQGKTAYAKQTYGLQDADIFTCGGPCCWTPRRGASGISERFALALRAGGKEPADELRTLDLSDKILLARISPAASCPSTRSSARGARPSAA